MRYFEPIQSPCNYLEPQNHNALNWDNLKRTPNSDELTKSMELHQ